MSNLGILIFGISIIFVATTLGAAVIYFFKKSLSPKLNGVVLGFAAGVMVAASVFGLILTALDQAEYLGKWNFLPVAAGLIIGALFLVVLDKLIPHIHNNGKVEGLNAANLNKSSKLFLAVTIHNIPEGLAVGFAFGNALNLGDRAAYIAALGLAIGIAIQNIPEGLAVSAPIYNSTRNKNKAFFFGMLSGLVEPVFAILGLILASTLTGIMPWLLAFAAGAMLFVTVEDLIPDAIGSHTAHFGEWGFMVGFLVMMVLDTALG